MAANENLENAEGSFISHLLELRSRLVRSVVAVVVVFIALVPFSDRLYTLLALPLLKALPKGATMIATEVTSPFLIPIKLTFVAALTLAIPYLLYQIWAFVAPGLYRHERRLVLPLLVSSTLLFYVGMAFAYFFVFPAALGFFTHVAPSGVQVMTDIKAYLSFAFTLLFGFGVAFEIPIAIILLVRAGVIAPESLAAKRPYIIVGVFAVAAFVTPPDVFSQTLLAVPMLILFEIGLFFARRLRPSDRPAEEADQALAAPASQPEPTPSPAPPAPRARKPRKTAPRRKKSRR